MILARQGGRCAAATLALARVAPVNFGRPLRLRRLPRHKTGSSVALFPRRSLELIEARRTPAAQRSVACCVGHA